MIIRFILLLCVMLLSSVRPSGAKWTTYSYSQFLKPRTAIDNITTAAQAQQFVTSASEQYRNFVLEETPKVYKGEFLLKRGGEQTNCMELLKCVDIKSISNWAKADFDNNGRTDLLVWGSFSKYAKPITACFLDLGPQNIQTQVVSKRNLVCDVITVITVRKRPAIQLAHLTYSKQTSTNCQLDTIIHDGTGFIGYNAHPENYHIQQVRLSVSKCYGRCPVYTIEINSDLTINYQAIAYNKKQGSFTDSLDRNTVQSLYSLLSYIRFPNLEDRTRFVNPDLSTYTLTITYADGQEKKIGGTGYTEHLGLERVYRILADIKTQQDNQ
jgi:hypothetical protein